MITIRNASGTVLTHFDNNVPEGNPYFEPEMTENMESLVSSFSFSVPLQLEGSEYLSKLNQVLAKDKDGDLRVFVINDVYEDWNTTDGTVRVVAEDISITEMNGIILPPITAMNFNDALKAVFNKSGWTYELTANPSELDRALFATEDYMNMREALVKLRTVYGCQFKFMAQEDAFGTLKRVVKVFKNRGNNTGKYFYYDRDLLNIERDINYNSIYTAVYATYKDEAGKSHNLINWLPNYPIDGFTKDYSSPLIVNDSAHLEWDEPTVYRTMLHKSDLHDPNQVFQEAVDALGKADEPIYTYKMNVLLLQNMIGWEGEDVNLGDTVWAKERVGDRELGLEARVIEYVYHEDDPTLDTVTFSNYVEIDTTDARELSNRIYFAYANSADGTKDFSTTDSVDKLYMGVYTSDVDVQSTDPSVYSWTRIRGEDGNSAPVLNLSATSMIMKFKSDNTPDGDQTITFQATVMYMAEDSVTWQATPYIGNAAQPDITLTGTGLSRTLQSSEWNIDWTRLVVRVSANGLADVITVTKVADGANGEAGEAVIGFLTNEAVTFAANSAGVVSDYSNGSGQFILYEGLRQVTSGVVYAVQSSAGITPSINTTTGEYVVDKMTANMAQVIFTASYKGVTITKSMSLSKSIAGQNGQDGQDGTDGQTIWTAYANSADGKTDFSLTDSDRAYIGTASGKASDTQPTDPTKYRWSRIKGADGTSFSMSGDSNVMKFDANGDIKAGQLITFRAIKKVLVDPIYWEAVPYINEVEQPQIILGGTQENTRTLAASQWGYGITSIRVKATCGDYEDTVTVVKLQDGANGANGASTHTWFAYSNSSDGSLDFSTTYDPSKGYKYIGVYNGTEKIAPEDYRLYTWMLFKGEAGENSFIHTAYANSADGVDGFTTEYPKPNLMTNTLQDTLATYKYSHNSRGALDTGTPDNQPPTYTNHTIRVSSTSVSAYGMASQTLNGSSAGFKVGDKVTISALVYIPDTLSSNASAFQMGKYDTSSGGWGNGNIKDIGERGGWFIISHTVTITDLSTAFVVGFGSGASTTAVESFWLAAMKVEKNPTFTGLYPNASDDPVKASPAYLGLLVDQVETPSQNPADYEWSRYTGHNGQDGQNGVTGILTNEAQQVASTSEGGVADYTAAKGTFQIYDGTTQVTSGVTFSVVDEDGGTTTIDPSSGFYSVTFVPKDVTNFIYEASYKTLKIRKTFTVSKSKQGVQGIQGVQGLMGIAFYSPTPPTGQGVKEGATWFKTVSDTDDTILSINTFKDGNWVETSLASGTLAVESLSAISANLGNITAGTITGVTITAATFKSPFDTTTTESTPRHITGTTTIAEGRMSSVMTFPDVPVENRTNAWFYTGPDSLRYIEQDLNGRTVATTKLNQDGFVADIYANPSSGVVTSRAKLTPYGMDIRGGDDPNNIVTLDPLALNINARTGTASNGYLGGWRINAYIGGGRLKSNLAIMLPDKSAPAASTSIENIPDADTNAKYISSYGAAEGLIGRRYQDNDKKVRDWILSPTILEGLQTGSQSYTVGNADGTQAWIPATDGLLLQFANYYYQSIGFMDDVDNMFLMASDRKTIRFANLPTRYKNMGSRIQWRITMYGKVQLGGGQSFNSYVYLALFQNGAEISTCRTVWPAGMGWQQTVVSSPAIRTMNLGDDFTVKMSTNLNGATNFLGGVNKVVFEPILMDNRGGMI